MHLITPLYPTLLPFPTLPHLYPHTNYPPLHTNPLFFMSKSNSLENINLQFRTIMGKMGLDEEKQNKLSHKLDLSKKIKTIISMQTLEERKKKICEYLERIRENFSLMSFLSLHCSLENGNKTLFSIFMNCKGEEIILKSIKEMEGDSINIILEFVFMLLEKYQWEVPSLLEIILKRYLEIKFKTNTFYKIIEYYIKKGDYEVIFKNTTPFGCVCSSYLSKIMCDNRNEGKVGGSSKDNGIEGGTTKSINEKQSISNPLSFSFLLDLLKKGNLKLEYVNYIENIFLNKPNTIIKKKCKSERLYEIIRIAEEKNLLELVTCVIESVVIGGKEYVTVLSKDKGVKGDKEKGEGDIKDISKEEGVKGGIKDLTLIRPNNDTPIHQPNLINTINQPTSNTTQPNTNTTQNTTHNKKKIIKKIVKKSTPLFSYEQLKWTKINKKGTIFEKVTKIEFKDKDLEPFIKKEIIKKDNPFLNLNKKTTIFPDKKNYALNIALSRIKLSDKELKDKILNLSQDLNMNLIKQLLLYFPTEEEKGVLKGRVDREDLEGGQVREDGVKVPLSNTHIQPTPFLSLTPIPTLSPTSSSQPTLFSTQSSQPTPTSHNRAESFFIECIPQIDLFKESLLLLNLKSLLDSLPISHLDTLSFYYQTILSSIPLKDLLGTLLSLGNSLNKGTPLGQAEGFTFDSILNLITPKTKEILRSYCNLNLFKKEFKILYEVQKISLESFKIDFKEVNEIKKEINIKDLNLKDKYKKIENKYKETNEFYEKACEYLNEKINEEFNMKFLEVYLSVVE